MNRKTILIIVLSVVAVLCLCGIVVGVIALNRAGSFIRNSTSSDPQDVQENAAKISDVQLPPGFTPAMSVSLMGVVMAGYTAPDNQTTIFLFQAPSDAQMSMEQFRKQVEQMAAQQTGESLQFQETDRLQASIRGQPTELIVYEGAGSSGDTIRQMIGEFEGKGGPAWIIVTGPANTWDESAIQLFISSMQ